jgi:hypothetical protein
MPIDIWNIHGFVLQEKSCTVYPSECTGAEIPAGLTETLGVTYPDLYAAARNFIAVENNIQDLRLWMKNHGQQNKPLYVSEYGVLFVYNTTDQQVRDSFMYPSFDYFLNTISTTIGYPADGYRLDSAGIGTASTIAF